MSPFMREKRPGRANPGTSVFVRVLDAGMTTPATRCGGRRPKPAQLRKSHGSREFEGSGAPKQKPPSWVGIHKPSQKNASFFHALGTVGSEPIEPVHSRGVSKLQGCCARLGDLHVAEAARTGAALEERDAEQPDAHDRLGWAADVLLVVRIDVTLVADPLAEIGETAADHHVRFERRPPGDRATERLADREAAAPEIGEVLAIVELRSDREIVVRRQLVFR